ncbi:MAG: hypothetical protein IBJ18_09335 [Phycisphaerales bacterium]|nr:hypothetical protein [Phycisphaerales bacterium]
MSSEHDSSAKQNQNDRRRGLLARAGGLGMVGKVGAVGAAWCLVLAQPAGVLAQEPKKSDPASDPAPTQSPGGNEPLQPNPEPTVIVVDPATGQPVATPPGAAPNATGAQPVRPGTTPGPTGPVGPNGTTVDPRTGRALPANPNGAQPVTPGATRAQPEQPVGPSVQPTPAPSAGRSAQSPAMNPGATPTREVRPEQRGENGAAAGPLPGTNAPLKEGWFRYGPVAEPLKLKLLADQVAAELGIQYLSTDLALSDKQVFLPTAIDVPHEQLLGFLEMLLEQNGMSLRKTGVGNIYSIEPINQGTASPISSDPFATTQIIATPGLRPSALQGAINAVLSKSGGAAIPGNPNPGGQPGGGTAQIAYLDDLGIMLVTDTPRKIRIISSVVEQLVAEQIKMEWTRFDVKYLAAAGARSRIIEVLNRQQGSSSGQQNVQPQPGTVVQGGGSSGGINNLADRLVVDSTSNALIFRGRSDEAVLLRKLLTVVDLPSKLEGRWYAVSGAAQIAQHAERSGYGRLITIDPQNSSTRGTGAFAGVPANQGAQNQFNPNLRTNEGDAQGTVIVLDAQARGFMYFATPELHEQMNQLIKRLEPFTESEAIVYEHYKIRHGKAEEIEAIVTALITNTAQAATAPLLPGGGGTGGANNRFPSFNNQAQRVPNQAQPNRAAADENQAIDASADVFVTADKPNNQVIVKAPKRLQPQFARLINKLDIRRPQVFVEAQIVVIDDNDGWRLAFETQWVDQISNNSRLAARSIFGTATNRTSLTGTPTVTPALNAFTMAIIKSDQVPIVITALANSTDAKVVAAPKLLVDDNEEAEISAIQEVPTTTTSQSGAAGSTVTSFGGFQEAGPKLKVKPQISSGDYLRLKYELELSNFVGSTDTASSIPPARNTSKISSESVTVPSDSTIIVGGLALENTSTTVLKVPLLGDIPLAGQLFRDQSETKTRRLIYVFITPRVMRDAEFTDLRLLSRGPVAMAKVSDPVPKMVPPTYIEIHRPSPSAKDPLEGLPRPMLTPMPQTSGKTVVPPTTPASPANPAPAASPDPATK